MEISGVLKVKKDEEIVSEKFKKREFVITESSGPYPQYISFQLTQNKCELIDPVQIGEEITVHFNLRGREWISPTGDVKYFNSLEAWRIERKNTGFSQSQENRAVNDAPAVSDDLPF